MDEVRLARPGSPEGDGSTASGLIERDRELARLSEMVEAAIRCEGGMALIEGPAGVGKTRLLQKTRELAESSGVPVLGARCGQLERDFPFGVVRQLLEPRVRASDERGSLFAGAAEAARDVFEEMAPAEESPAVGASFATLHGLYWLLLNVAAERPLALAIDDLQWCDPSSLRFLAFLLRRLDGLPILILASQRSAEPGTDPALLSELAHDPLTTSIAPRPLSEEAVQAVTSARLGAAADERFAAACHRATGGNPLLLSELLSALRTEQVTPIAANARVVGEIGARPVSGSVRLRLSRLSEEAIAVARGCAVLGEGATVRQISALIELDDERVAAATGELVRAEILRQGDRLGFIHPLVLDAVYGELSLGEREVQHARAAELLREGGASRDAVATQLLVTSPRGNPEIAQILQEAGRSASRRGAADSAVTYLRRALEEGPDPARRPQVLFELGVAEALTNGSAAAHHLRQAYESLEDPVAKAIAAHVVCRVLTFMESPRQAAEFAARAAGELPPELEDLNRAFRAFEMVVRIAFAAGDVTTSDWRAELDRFRADGVGPGVGEKMLAAGVSMLWANADGSAEDCSKLALAALRDGELIAADNGYLDIIPMLVLAMADREEAIEVADAILAEAQRHGSLFAVSSLHGWRALVLHWRGDLEGAEEMLRTGFDELQMWGLSKTSGYYAGGFIAITLLERGDVAGARQFLERTGTPTDASDGSRFWWNGMMKLLLAEGRTEEAIEAADAFAERHSTVLNPATSWWRSAKAEALARQDRPEEAIPLLEEQLAYARRWGAPGTVGHALRELGAIKREQGLGELEEAVGILEGTPARLELAKSLCALGTALRHSRKPAVAREPLRRALDLRPPVAPSRWSNRPAASSTRPAPGHARRR